MRQARKPKSRRHPHPLRVLMDWIHCCLAKAFYILTRVLVLPLHRVILIRQVLFKPCENSNFYVGHTHILDCNI